MTVRRSDANHFSFEPFVWLTSKDSSQMVEKAD
jgi:hypothetical protein